MGRIDKDSSFRDRVVAKISSDKWHPYNNDIKMQAHHLISAKGVEDIPNISLVADADYDINHVKNISLIPSTLAGACQLYVQLHRGNHTSEEESDIYDDQHPRGYHETVYDLVLNVVEMIEDDCIDDSGEREKVILEMNNISNILVNLINNFSPQAQLTRIYKYLNYQGENSLIGCAGSNNVPGHDGKSECPCDRQHIVDNMFLVRYNKLNPYKLEAGK